MPRHPSSLVILGAALLALLATTAGDCGEPALSLWQTELGAPDTTGDAPTDAPDGDATSDPATDALSDAEPSDLGDQTDLTADSDVAMEPDVAADPDVPEPQPWRSALYPEDWTPASTDGEGRFLHDFSYAGYHNGETELGTDIPALTIDVVADHGADPTAETDSTAAFQAALDAAAEAGGAVVFVPEGRYRLDGVLSTSASRVVLRGAGRELSRLYFTRFDGMSYQSHITFRGQLSSDLEVPLAVDADNRATVVEVADASDLAVGDDVTLGFTITPDFVAEHGMTEVWQAFNGTWQPFFWREVRAIDRDASPQRVTLDVPLRYPALVRDGASLRRERGTLTECGVEQLGLANAVGWEDAWAQNQVHVLELDAVADCWVRDVATFASPAAPETGDGRGTHLQSGGLLIRRAKRVTVADTVLERAEHRGSGGNGYLFEIRQSSEVLFRDCVGRDGRHNFIQNWGFGATGIVWLRVESSGGRTYSAPDIPIAGVGLSEFHHSLATANLIDSSSFADGWGAINRDLWSTGAGLTATQNVFWNIAGRGQLDSKQYGWGYIIGTGQGLSVDRRLGGQSAAGTAPEDWLEGYSDADTLVPQSLYEDQLARRLGR